MGLYFRKSGQTKKGWPESEERGPGNPVRGSSLQQVHEDKRGKLRFSDYAAG